LSAPLSVYLVEDQPRLQAQIIKLLSVMEGVEVVGCASTGEEAVEALPGVAPRVALLDLELPGIDGLEVLTQVRPALPETVFLILTTFDDEEKVYEAIQRGASGYLVKRIAPQRLESAIHEAAEGGVVIEGRIARRFWNYFQSVQGHPPQLDTRGLSEVEIEVLEYLARGLSNAEVGEIMAIDRRRVRTHLGHIYAKLEVSSHVEAVVAALRLGIVSL